MISWPAPEVPAVPGQGLPVRLHDTATGGTRPTAPGEVATMYVCGITPYDATHLGHAATYVAFDLLNRAWRDAAQAQVVEAVCTAATGLDATPLEVALAWARDHEDVAAVVVGARTAAQLRASLAADDLVLPDAIRQALDDVSSRP